MRIGFSAVIALLPGLLIIPNIFVLILGKNNNNLFTQPSERWEIWHPDKGLGALFKKKLLGMKKKFKKLKKQIGKEIRKVTRVMITYYIITILCASIDLEILTVAIKYNALTIGF